MRLVVLSKEAKLIGMLLSKRLSKVVVMVVVRAVSDLKEIGVCALTSGFLTGSQSLLGR